MKRREIERIVFFITNGNSSNLIESNPPQLVKSSPSPAVENELRKSWLLENSGGPNKGLWLAFEFLGPKAKAGS